MPRFVILEHSHRGTHWDFMLEAGAVLRTWALDRPPDSPGPIAARRSFDHRAMYLDYEGPIGGDRGEVRRWDAGTYRMIEDSAGAVEVELRGGRLGGRVRLECYE